MLYRTFLLTCVCTSSLLGCGHPIRELASAAKDLIPDKTPKSEPKCPAQATSRIELIANLGTHSEARSAWDPARPEATSNFVVSSSPFASDGQRADLQIFFVRTAVHSWSWHALATQAATSEIGGGALTFDEQGALTSANTTRDLRLPRGDGSLSAPIALWLGTPKSAETDGFDGVTSTAEPSALHSYEQDGHAVDADTACPET